jgi:hypothetical protein
MRRRNPNPLRSTITLLAAIGLSQPGAFAQGASREVEQVRYAVEIRQITLAPKQGRGGDLAGAAMAVGPSSDFFALIPRGDGAWRLDRVRGWSGVSPVVDQLALPGYFTKAETHDLEELEAAVYVTPDSHYALCAGTALWKLGTHRKKSSGGNSAGEPAGDSASESGSAGHMESLITVVDLETFKPIATLDTDALHSVPFDSVWMDKEGRGVIAASDSGPDGKRFLLQLAIPALTVEARCDYTDVAGADKTLHPVAKDERQCASFSSGSGLADYLAESTRYNSHASAAGYSCDDAGLEYCPQPDTISSDDRVAMGIEKEGHDTILGWKETRAIAVFFSVSTQKEFARLDVTQNPAHLELAVVGGEEYLLSLKNGAELTVYRLRAP